VRSAAACCTSGTAALGKEPAGSVEVLAMDWNGAAEDFREVELIGERKDIEDAESCADGRLTAAERIPGHADAGLEVPGGGILEERRPGVSLRGRERSQVDELAVDLVGNGGSFIAQADIHREIAAQADIVFRVAGVDALASSAGCQHSILELERCRLVEQEVRERVEPVHTVGIGG